MVLMASSTEWGGIAFKLLMHRSYMKKLLQAELPLLDTLDTRTLVGNLSERAVGIGSEPVW